MDITNLQRPFAAARISGSSAYPDLRGMITFRQTNRGVLVTAEVSGLPQGAECASGIFALHIHEGGSCTGNEQDPFADSGMHYNPKSCPHPYHAGDLPPLFANDGYAFFSVLTDRFTVEEITGRVIIVHAQTDDFTTQPSGNAGAKIGCGKIVGR